MLGVEFNECEDENEDEVVVGVEEEAVEVGVADMDGELEDDVGEGIDDDADESVEITCGGVELKVEVGVGLIKWTE